MAQETNIVAFNFEDKNYKAKINPTTQDLFQISKITDEVFGGSVEHEQTLNDIALLRSELGFTDLKDSQDKEELEKLIEEILNDSTKVAKYQALTKLSTWHKTLSKLAELRVMVIPPSKSDFDFITPDSVNALYEKYIEEVKPFRLG